MKAEWYCVVKNNIILEVYHTADGIEGVKQSTQLQYDEIKKMPDHFEGTSGLHLNELEGNKIKPIEQRIIEGYRSIPEGYELKNNQLVEIQKEQNILTGLELENYNKLISNTLLDMAKDRLGNDINKPMTDEERDILILNTLKQIAEEKLENDFINSIGGY